MDPAGGGPGPPRPAPSPVQNIAPAPPEGSLPIFPFNAGQQQTPLSLQIAHGAASIPIPNPGSSPFDASEPFGSNPFLASIPGRPGTDANPSNPARNVGPAMLQNVDQAAPHTQSAAVPQNQQRQAAPQQLSHQTSRDFFGELEKALSEGGPPQNAPDFDVLDHAIAGGSQQPSPPQQAPIVSNAVASQPLAQGIQPWPQSQSQTSHLQRAAQIQQSQLQSQLQQQQQQEQIRQRKLQQQAHIAQQQQLRQQHFQNQQIRQEQFRQQQQFGQLRQLQPQPQQQNVTLMNQPQQQPQANRQTQSSAQSQPQKQQPALLTQQPSQSRTQPMHQYAPKHIQPAVILPIQAQGSIQYPPGYVGQANIASTRQTQNTLGNMAASTGGGQAPTVGIGVQQRAGISASQPSRSKTKSKKTSQRRPRAKSLAKNMQGRSSQSQSPSPSQSSSQQAAYAAQVSQLPLQPQPPSEQMSAFAQQQQYASSPQNIQPSPAQIRQTPEQLQQARKHELQTRLLQQRQLPDHANLIQPALRPVGSSRFVPTSSFLPSEARTSAAHRGGNVTAGESSSFGALQVSRNLGLSSAVPQSQPTKLPGKESVSPANLDREALQKILSRTTDPKVYAALQQQLQIVQGNGSGQGVNRSHPTGRNAVHIQPQGQVLRQGSAAAPAAQVGAPLAGQHGVGTGALPSSQGTLPNQHQLLQQEQGYSQQQRPQRPEHLQTTQRSLAMGQQHGTAHIFPRGMGYRQQASQQSRNVLNPHANQSMASLPQYMQHQIRAQIQAQHIQAQLQNQSRLSSQRSSAVPGSVFQSEAEKGPAVIPQRSPSPSENRKARRSPKALEQNAIVSQANGAVESKLIDDANVKTGVPLATSGPNAPIVTGQLSKQLPMSTVSQPQLLGRTAALHQAVANVAGSQNAQFVQNDTLRNTALRRVTESKKLIEERKRLAREAELKELATQKKRRLETAPSSDYQGVLAPDYKSPFAGQVHAWQRLVPFHCLLSKDDDFVSSEDWNAGITKLGENYREMFRDLRKKVLALSHREPDFDGDEVRPGVGPGLLSNGDCIVMETVLLEDFYETARQEKALAESKAREIARQRAIELEAARRTAEQAALAAAREAALRSERERHSIGQSEGWRSMASGTTFSQVSPGNGQGGSLPGGGQTLDPRSPVSLVNNTVLGAPVQLPRQTGSGQAYQSNITGFAPAASMHAVTGDRGDSRPMLTSQSSQMQVPRSEGYGPVLSGNSPGISLAFQHARQAAVPRGQILGYHTSALRGSQQVAQAVLGQQNMSVRSSAPVSSQAWVNHEIVTANVQSGGHSTSSGVVGGRSNGMNVAVGSGAQPAVNGASGGSSHLTKVMSAKAGPSATSSQQSHVSHEPPVVRRMGTPRARGVSSGDSRPRGQPAKISAATAVATQGPASQSNGFGVIGMGLSVSGKQVLHSNHSSNVAASRVGGSSRMMSGQLPTYHSSMQAKGPTTTAQIYSSGRTGMSPLQQGAGAVTSVHTSSQVPMPETAKSSPAQALGTATEAQNASGQKLGPSGANAAHDGQHGGKQRRSMGMGSLLNADKR